MTRHQLLAFLRNMLENVAVWQMTVSLSASLLVLRFYRDDQFGDRHYPVFTPKDKRVIADTFLIQVADLRFNRVGEVTVMRSALGIEVRP